MRLFEAVNKNYDLSDCIECTVECNPESTYRGLLGDLKSCGVNRISMGVQSFDDNELKFLGRPHNSKDVYKAYERIVSAGFENINLDLILAITNQTVKSLEYNLNEICRLSPEHISAYILKIEENTALGKLFTKDPDEEITEKMYLMTSEKLTAEGYEHYEVSNFAKPGFRSRHNMNYWQDGEYIAFGAGAYGYADGIRYRYSSDFRDFIYKKGFAEKITEEKITETEKRKEKIMLSLRLSDGLSKEYIRGKKDTEFFQRLISRGLATEKPDAYALTPKGFLVSNSIINELMD
jgi:oxygen-independent coproporphyrinogen-3 oxidase